MGKAFLTSSQGGYLQCTVASAVVSNAIDLDSCSTGLPKILLQKNIQMMNI